MTNTVHRRLAIGNAQLARNPLHSNGIASLTVCVVSVRSSSLQKSGGEWCVSLLLLQ